MKKLLFFLVLFISLNCFGAYKYYDGSKSGSGYTGADWDNAWSQDDLRSDIESGTEKDNVIFCKNNTTLTANISSNRTTAYTFIGVKSSTTAEPPAVSDWAYGDDRPLFICAAYRLLLSNYDISMLNFIFTGAYNGDFILPSYKGVGYNLKVTNEYNDVNGASILCRYGYLFRCEAISTYGIGIEITACGSAKKCYVHDSAQGIRLGAAGASVSENVIKKCDVGIYLPYDGTANNNNTIDDCSIGIDINNSKSLICDNNITNCDTGLQDSSNIATIIAGNNYYNNTNRTSGTIATEISYTELDPQFVDASNENFLPQNKALIGNAYPSTFVGTSTPNYSIAGAAQMDASSGDGGTCIVYPGYNKTGYSQSR